MSNTTQPKNPCEKFNTFFYAVTALGDTHDEHLAFFSLASGIIQPVDAGSLAPLMYKGNPCTFVIEGASPDETTQVERGTYFTVAKAVAEATRSDISQGFEFTLLLNIDNVGVEVGSFVVANCVATLKDFNREVVLNSDNNVWTRRLEDGKIPGGVHNVMRRAIMIANVNKGYFEYNDNLKRYVPSPKYKKEMLSNNS